MLAKMSRVLVVLMAVVLMICSTPGPALSQVIWTIGIGRTTCGAALQNIEKDRSKWETHYLTWIGGFISGYNMARANATKKDVRVGEGVSNEKIAAIFKNKCKQDALKPLPQAAIEIREELAAYRQ